MDLKPNSRWYDYSRARDAMFAATDTAWAPWFVAHSDDKKRARLNIIIHLLSQIPYEDLPGAKVVLPKRQEPGDYRERDYPFKFAPAIYCEWGAGSRSAVGSEIDDRRYRRFPRRSTDRVACFAQDLQGPLRYRPLTARNAPIKWRSDGRERHVPAHD